MTDYSQPFHRHQTEISDFCNLPGDLNMLSMQPLNAPASVEQVKRVKAIAEEMHDALRRAQRVGLNHGEILYDICNENHGLGDEISIGTVYDQAEFERFSITCWQGVYVGRSSAEIHTADRLALDLLGQFLAPTPAALVREKYEAEISSTKSMMFDSKGYRFRTAPLAQTRGSSLSIVFYDGESQVMFSELLPLRVRYTIALDEHQAEYRAPAMTVPRYLTTGDAQFLIKRSESLLRFGSELLARFP